jgi:hypothetical protein
VKRSRLLLVLAVLPFAAIRLSAGCTAQGEGQLCSILNNTVNGDSNDCATGLVCVTKATQNMTYDVCCPPSGSTDPACAGGDVVGGVGGGGGAGGAGGGSATTTTGTTGTGGLGGAGGADAGSDAASDDAADAAG